MVSNEQGCVEVIVLVINQSSINPVIQYIPGLFILFQKARFENALHQFLLLIYVC